MVDRLLGHTITSVVQRQQYDGPVQAGQRRHADPTRDFVTLTIRCPVSGQDVCEVTLMKATVMSSGDLGDLVGAPLTQAEFVEAIYGGHETWTFYRFATRKGSVTIRFYGTSNGYYSESVNVHLSGVLPVLVPRAPRAPKVTISIFELLGE